MKPDCRACGLCCVPEFDDEAYVDLLPNDVRRLPARMARHVRLQPRFLAEPSPVLATKHDKDGNCVCVALRGRLARAVSCGVYAQRPDACRNAIQPGDKDCKSIRMKYEALFEDES